MHKKRQSELNLLLLISLLLVILLFPILDYGDLRRLILSILVFVPVILATVKLSEKRLWMWPGISLMSAIILTTMATWKWPGPRLHAFKWALLALFFGLAVVHLFSYIRYAHAITNAQLYTAISIYLLLGMQWFALYMCVYSLSPGALLLNNSALTTHHTEILYFSLVTLSTIGYGDVVPVQGEIRMLAALEGITGVLYVAITVALLVNAYRQQANTD